MAQIKVTSPHEEILLNREIGIEVIELRDDTHAIARIPSLRGNCKVSEADDTRVSGGQTKTAAKCRGLTGTIGSQYSEALAATDRERHAIYDHASIVSFDETLGPQDRVHTNTLSIPPAFAART
jgi:hypothetical protein